MYKIRTILDIIINKFRTNYIPDREISLDDGILGWQGRLQFCVYSPCKITKYLILVRMVCESSTGYICALQIYDGKCGPLTERWVSYSSLMKGKVTTYTKTITTIVSIKQMNYYRNYLESVEQSE